MDLSKLPTMQNLEVAGKRVLVRADLDTPMRGGEIVDDTRIRLALPTIEYLVERGARVIVMSHRGQPGGKVDPSLGLEPIAVRLAELLSSGEIILGDAPVGDGVKRVALDLRDGQVALLENLRFHAGEMRNDDKLARGLAALGEIYVADALGPMCQPFASTTGVARHLGSRAAGLLLEKEIKAFDALMKKPESPYVAVVGGDAFSEKIDLIQCLSAKAATIILGGGIANTVIAAAGGRVGQSRIEEDKFAVAREFLRQAKAGKTRVILPTDVVVAGDGEAGTVTQSLAVDVPEWASVVDVGDASRANFKDVISRAKTVFWNGPMGVYEKEPFAGGTIAMARTIAGSAAFSVVAGDDTVAAVRTSGLEKGFNHVSGGGDALLRLLEGQDLPGLQSLAGS